MFHMTYEMRPPLILFLSLAPACSPLCRSSVGSGVNHLQAAWPCTGAGTGKGACMRKLPSLDVMLCLANVKRG